MPIQQNWSSVNEGLRQQIKDTLNRVVEGVDERLQVEIQQASSYMMLAASRNRPDLVDEARDIILLAIEEGELHVRKEFEDTFETVLGVGLGLLFNGLSLGLNALTVI